MDSPLTVSLRRLPARFENGRVIGQSGTPHGNRISFSNASWLLLFMYERRHTHVVRVVALNQEQTEGCAFGVFYPYYVTIEGGAITDWREVPGYTGGYIHHFFYDKPSEHRVMFDLVAAIVSRNSDIGTDETRRVAARLDDRRPAARLV